MNLTCERYFAAGLGRFRIAFTTGDNAKASQLPDHALAILRKYREPEKRKALLVSTEAAGDREALLRQFVKVAPELADERKKIEKLQAEMPKFPTTLVLRERPPGHLRHTFRQHRGEFLQPKEEVFDFKKTG